MGGSSPNYVIPVRQQLDQKFQNCWIEKAQPVLRPACLSDLTSCDYNSGRCLKDIVFEKPPNNKFDG